MLIADGSTKPISQVKVGDQVTDAVPGDSTQQTHTVHNVITTTTDRDFVDVTVTPSKLGKALAGVALAVAATLTTTFHHPFYDITQSSFVEAVDLKAGDQVQTADGGTATVTDVYAYHQQATTYDLTINGLHTYYVLAGDTPVLVHNNDGGQCPLFRGTTIGYEGSPGTQRVGVTPTSTDPGVATIFATHSEQFGEAVVQIALPGDLEGVETYSGYIPSEAEVGVDLTPGEFAERASLQVSAGEARSILSRMGISVPRRIGIEDLSPLLAEVSKLSAAQIGQFLDGVVK